MSTSWPNAILHLDADAFFASVTQAIRPELQGKPIVSGLERGIATAVSYEAKKLGVIRGMPCWEIKKQFPQVIITASDYRLYHLFSDNMFSVMKKYSPSVEIYSIDEGFMDLRGLEKPFNMSYEQIGKALKNEIENSLGITVSIGISITKSLAKIAANLNKPSGLTIAPKDQAKDLLKQTGIEKVWGIGYRSAPKLRALNIKTAYDFTIRPEGFIKSAFPKPFYEIWQELNGILLFSVDPQPKANYKSITKSQTITPAITNKSILWARILTHVESSFLKARKFNYSVGKIFLYLKTQKFTYHEIELKIPQKTSFPILIRKELRAGFKKIYHSNTLYRATGVTISDFSEDNSYQGLLFPESPIQKNKARRIYALYDKKQINFATTLLSIDRKTSPNTNFHIPLFPKLP